MSSKQFSGRRSLFIVYSSSRVGTTRVADHDRKLQRLIPAMVFQLTLATLGRFASDIACAVMDALAAALSWLMQEFLTGCAAYAEAMYPLPPELDHRSPLHDRATPELKLVNPPAAAPRPYLVAVSEVVRHETAPHELHTARQSAISVRPPAHDRSLLQHMEALRPSRAFAARRKNRPR